MKHKFMVAAVSLVALLGSAQVTAGAVETLQSEYIAAGAGPFSAEAGAKRWQESHIDAESGQARNCQSCHGQDLSVKGKHARTGKVIEPLAPSVNGERLTDIKFINKWFTRNCKWTLGRECTPQEKGDFLEYLKGQ